MKKKAAALFFLGMLTGLGIFYFSSRLPASERRLLDAFEIIEGHYVDRINTDSLSDSAVGAMLLRLDPHSIRVSRAEQENDEGEFSGGFVGIGIEFIVAEDTALVLNTVRGGPSEAGGLKPGDRIIEVNGRRALGLKAYEIRKLLQGPEGSYVRVSCLRPGRKKALNFVIRRSHISLPSVKCSRKINGHVGYILITKFSETTADELKSSIDRLIAENAKYLILDLRGNPGGLLDAAVAASDLFLPKGRKIVYTKGRSSKMDECFYSTGRGPYREIPLTVLINGSSASAAEIFSGSLQDNDRALILGSRSFGKGLVQRTFLLADRSAIRLTVARYFIPSGRQIQKPYSNRNDYFKPVPMKTSGYNYNHSLDFSAGLKPFWTFKGRPVYGGGGITPDFIVNDRTSDSEFNWYSFQGFILPYINTSLAIEGQNIYRKYSGNIYRFMSEYRLPERFVQGCISSLSRLGLQGAISENSRRALNLQIKNSLAEKYFGEDKYLKWSLEKDESIIEALRLEGLAKNMR